MNSWLKSVQRELEVEVVKESKGMMERVVVSVDIMYYESFIDHPPPPPIIHPVSTNSNTSMSSDDAESVSVGAGCLARDCAKSLSHKFRPLFHVDTSLHVE